MNCCDWLMFDNDVNEDVGKPVRPQVAFMAGCLGFFGGFAVGLRNTASRLIEQERRVA